MIAVSRQEFDDYLEQQRGSLSTAIHDLWVARDPGAWGGDSYYYTRLGELADKTGQAMFAHDLLQEGLGRFPGDLRLTQLYCLSLIKCGFLVKARELLTGLVKQGNLDEETLGILGRVYKEMWLIQSDAAPRHPYLHRSRKLYLKAFSGSRGNYSGINAASLSLMMGDELTARKLARMVVRICAKGVKAGGARDYWILATLGEAYVLLGKPQEAVRYYRLARQASGKNYASLASTRRQLKLLARFTQVDEPVLATLSIPPVVAFTGHMLDAPTRKAPRFPVSSVEAVRRQIRAVLDRLDAGIGYSSAACGSDVLFLECLQERGGETNVVLPFDREDFFHTSVNFAGEQWMRRADAVLGGNIPVDQANRGKYGGDDLLFAYANHMIMGKALLRSRLLETEAHLVTVWDGRRNGATGGTSDFVEVWGSLRLPVTVIDPKSAQVRELAEGGAGGGKRGRRSGRAGRRLAAAGRLPSGLKRGLKAGEVGRKIVAILFADLVGFSRLQEEQFPRYIEGFLGTVARRLKASAHQPVFKNIWGDAILFVFLDLTSAAQYAMELRDLVRDTDWRSLGLPEDLSIRIGLHAGPVYHAREPLLGRLNFFGSHVNQAARIEPITSPGNVYASEQFAAFMLADPANRLESKYVGVIVLPKEFGSYPIYHIKRRNEID